MKQLTARGKTVDDAIQSALQQLRISKEEVEVTVIDEGSKGFLNLFGAKPAVVKVVVKTDNVQAAKDYLESVIRHLHPGTEVEITARKKKHVMFTLSGENLGMLIGKRGQTLNALEQLVEQFLHQQKAYHFTVTVDAEGYRSRRRETLEMLAVQAASKALALQKAIPLDPMPASERKIIHAAAQKQKDVETVSKGKEPNRYIVIQPVKEKSWQ
ncbi:RNA-binding cell elongation regulator Jag/EloR [Terribacillus saccharophilus]|uniref:RNA-binding cell elongation regulator Jag/EloR n=1 Tax=Terribacillus saccharophilus TaxID=361277 RepID=UPI002989E230|nr:RNA-binding cell elongation regulator Jag/EloR [Terribacillus saccharophilus]MCM3227048.1 protein jag [Terribacillus saccharophilus]MEC0284442.1 RNA-binding cell elongation regulator Jag/EloR [Terribacillus saccharophilus]MEC0291120.1 RNA-binding cell elongation regulator Jag/EloR [Terribacillus saccharophilus]